MPKFGILIARDDHGWWSYTLVLNHRIVKTVTPFASAMVAFKTALADANIRGDYKGE